MYCFVFNLFFFFTQYDSRDVSMIVCVTIFSLLASVLWCEHPKIYCQWASVMYKLGPLQMMLWDTFWYTMPTDDTYRHISAGHTSTWEWKCWVHSAWTDASISTCALQVGKCLEGITDWTTPPPPNSYVEAPNSHVTRSGDRAFRKVINVKWAHMSPNLTGWAFFQGVEETLGLTCSLSTY